MTFLKIGIVLCAGAILLSVVTAIRKVKNKSAPIQRENSAATKIESIENVSRYFGYGFIAVFSIVFLNSSIVQSLHFGSLPRGSWSMGYFSGEAPQFYFKQLLEFSFVYFFSFIAIFRYQKNEPAEATVIRLFAIIILIFYMFWGSYQSRYILAGIPFLIILAFSVMAEAYRGISRIDNFLMRPAVKAGFVLLIGYIFLKTVMINMLVSYPNNLCYF